MENESVATQRVRVDVRVSELLPGDELIATGKVIVRVVKNFYTRDETLKRKAEVVYVNKAGEYITTYWGKSTTMAVWRPE